MPDLSACYFCGAAADAQVREYDVVPDAADESLRSTATLCPGCREKLETVLSSVVRGARPSDEPVDVELAPADASDDAAASTPALDVETEDILAAADRSRDEDDATSATSGEDADAASGAESDASVNDPLGSPAEGSTSAQPTDGIAFDDAADAGASDDGDAEVEADGADPGADAGTAPGADAGTASDDDAGASSSPTPSDDVERPDSATYNRVVRLLQNREFPVNRSEFSDLASSAYDIPADECAQVIDYAIHRGELVEDRGMLKKA